MSKKNKKKTGYNYNANINSGNTEVVKNVTVNAEAVTNTDTGTGTTAAKPSNVYNYSTFKSYSTKTPYTYLGVKNETKFPEFVELCKLTQKELIELLPTKLKEAGYESVVVQDGFIYAKGEIPYLVTAHMDTVHEAVVKDFYEYVDTKGNHIISSPQGIGGDDRCGIYMILQIIKEYKPTVLFCEDEECGGIGSEKFCRTGHVWDLSDMKYLIELDRANAKDAVFYSCDNPEFTKFIEKNTGYKESWGSFSDISTLAPNCGIAAVNLSCGYYSAHTLQEKVNVEEMLNTIEVVKRLFEVECEQFEYVEKKRSYYGGYSGYGYYGSSYYNRYYDDYDDYNVVLCVTFYDYKAGKEKTECYSATTKSAAWFKFFQDNPNTCWNDVTDYDYDYEVF